MNEMVLLPPLITDYSSTPAGGGASFSTGNSQSAWSRGGSIGFGLSTPGRFGHPSNNAFFTRHTANPKRVKHIKGLLGVNICSVNDEGYFSNPRYSFQYNPQTARTPLSSRGPLTASSRGAMTSRSDLRTMIGRSSGGDKVWGTRTFKLRRPGPQKTFVPEVWRDELRAITDVVLRSTGGDDANVDHKAAAAGQTGGATWWRSEVRSRDEVTVSPAEKPTRKTQYSSETGRLVPSPSKQLTSRSRWTSGTSGSRDQHRWTDINEETQADDLMMQMLCQVLQTEDIGAVQAWLISAHDREKATVIEMIRTAMDNRDVQDLLAGTHTVRDRQSANEWSLEEFNVDAIRGKVDRLLIEDDDASGKSKRLTTDDVKIRDPPQEGATSNREAADTDKDEFDKARRPVTAGAFRRQSKHSSEHRADRDSDRSADHSTDRNNSNSKNRKSCLKKASGREPSLSREVTNIGNQSGRHEDPEAAKHSKATKQPMKRSNTTVY